MVRQRVESSNLAEVGWEYGILEAVLRGGATYRYWDVPEEVFWHVLAGSVGGSVGRTFNQLVVRGGYRYVRMGDTAIDEGP